MYIIWIFIAMLVPLGVMYLIAFPKKDEDKVFKSDFLLMDFSLYHKYLVRSIKSSLDVYAELADFKENHELIGFQIGIKSRFIMDGFEVIIFSERTTGYAYHNFVSWTHNDKTVSIGFAKSKTSEKEDYLFFSDPDKLEGDTQVGCFRNGVCFFIFLPDLLTEDKVELTSDSLVSFEEISKSYAIDKVSDGIFQ